MPGADVQAGPPGSTSFARQHLWRIDSANGVAPVVAARLLAYQPSSLSFIDLTLDAAGSLNTAGGGGGGGGAATIADGADVAEGATTDGAVVTDTAGTVSGKLRGLVKHAYERMPASLGQKTMANSLPVTLASDQSKLLVTADPVTFAAPQHAIIDSGTLTTLTGITNVVHVDDNAASLTVDAPVATPVFARLSDGAAALVGQKTMALSLPVTFASDQASVPVVATAPALTKGTQGATGFSTQELRDAGRNTRIFMLDAFVAAPVVEAVQTVVQWYGNAAVAGTTQPAVVPAGKTLRLTGWRITYRSIATFGSAIVRIRANTGGLGVLGSPLVASFEAGSNLGATTVAIVGAVTTETGEFPEGLELPAGTGLAFSMAGYGPTGVLTLEGPTRFEVHGYEY